MNQQALIGWLALALTPRLRSNSFAKLISIAPPHEWLLCSTKELQASGFTSAQIQYLKHQSEEKVTPIVAWGEDDNNHIITLDNTAYPPLLKQVSSPPRVLYAQGLRHCLSDTQLAIVGSRHASIDGLGVAKQFAKELAESGLTITSGLAVGIDGYAHQGALEGNGNTVAVLGSGLNRIYPAKHQHLAEKIAQQGALVSEFPPNTPPRRENFPRRNRIISGLSTGVLVVEAAERSGSLITARYAAEQGREVFAIPGSIHSPTHRGNNRLIKQGACLVQTVDDIVSEIETLVRWTEQAQPKTLFDEPDSTISNQIIIEVQQKLPFPELFANVGLEPTPIDILMSRTHIPIQELMNQLLELELLGVVTSVPGGYVRLGGGKL
ncbi:DNA-processing protein DprA [Vibrio sp. FNV 38]|nr:DNA-processing protein DprA [Vibrio sp. FNV 38]